MNATDPSEEKTLKASLYSRIMEFLQQRTLLSLALIAVTGIFVIVVYLFSLTEKLIVAVALENASDYATALSEFRSLYTSEVISRIEESNIKVTHDYLDKKNAIPLPATLSMELGNKLTSISEGGKVRLYSDHPFPWRKGGKPQDAFEHRAIRHLRASPSDPYYTIERYGGIQTIRYAVADVMREESCVKCHNSHPESPKRDWKVGDVRGVLEVIQPLDKATSTSRSVVKNAMSLIIIMSVIGFSMLGVLISRLRNSMNEANSLADERKKINEELERKNTERMYSNKVLASEIRERQKAEEGLRKALAESESMRTEVEQFNRFAVDRELRMIQLKQKVNGLLSEKGENELYDLKGIVEEE